MKKFLFIFCLLFSLSAHADDLMDVATSPTTFAVCKTIDIASTAYIIHTGIGYEANGLVASLLTHGYFPLILVSAGIWYWLKKEDNKVATGTVNAVTCGVSLHNLILIAK